MKSKITLEDIDWLKDLNRILTDMQTMLLLQLDRLRAELVKRMGMENVLLHTSIIELEIRYFIRKDDRGYNVNQDNILTMRVSNLTYDFLVERDWSHGFAEEFGFNQHCWMFHDLYNHKAKRFPVLSIEEMLRIGDIWINVRLRHPYEVNEPTRNFEMKYIYPIESQKTMAHLTTFSGRRPPSFPATPKRSDILIEDIIQGLSNQCRHFGQTRQFYSIAQHSLLLAALLPDNLKPAALLYAAPFAYMGEYSDGVRQSLKEIVRYETRMRLAIAYRFSVNAVPYSEAPFLTARARVLATEKRDVLPELFASRNALHDAKPMKSFIICMSPEEAKRELTKAFQTYLPTAFSDAKTVI